MQIFQQAIITVLEIYKWIILARVLLSWLPAAGIYLSPTNPIIRVLYGITDPILKPLQPFSRLGMIDLSPLVAFFMIGFIQNIIGGRPVSYYVSLIITLVIAFSVHEFAHAFVAMQQGDPTAKNQGRLTLDPRKHLDVLGTLMILAVGFGWAKPVPVNPYNLRSGPKTGMLIVAAAGPISNLIMAVLAGIPLKLGLIDTTPIIFDNQLLYYFLPTAVELISTFVWINVVLFFFNLLPIAPLDGYKVVAGLLPYPTSQTFMKLEPFGPMILLLLVFLGGPIFNSLIFVPSQFVMQLIT